MKEMKSLEMQLRSWELRPPSARAKRQLFSAERPARDRRTWSFRWLTPAAACLVFAGIILNAATQSVPTFTLALGDHNLADETPPPPENIIRNRIEWTSAGAFTSSVASFLPGKVN